MTRPAVLPDRDATIVEDAGFLRSLDAMTLFPWPAAAAGARAILVRTGRNDAHRAAPPHADAILDNSMEAVDWILRSSR